MAVTEDALALSETIVDRLRNLILSGDLAPHSKLTQRDLADQFGVSAMPVRDAIKQLIGEGFVVAEGQKTIVVAPLNADDFLDIMQMRLLLEPRALELAAPYLREADFAGIDAILSSAAAQDTPRDQVDKHWQFHQALYQPCRRPRLMATIEAQHLHLNRYLLPNWANVGVGAHWAVVERDLVDLVRTGDTSKAMAFLRDDVETTIIRVLRVLRF
jgi:DNA-binding GntR family transcriptional regulator